MHRAAPLKTEMNVIGGACYKQVTHTGLNAQIGSDDFGRVACWLDLSQGVPHQPAHKTEVRPRRQLLPARRLTAEG